VTSFLTSDIFTGVLSGNIRIMAILLYYQCKYLFIIMKAYKPIYRFIIVFSVTFGFSIVPGSGINTEHNFPNEKTTPEYILPGTYLVVGAFAIEDNAKNFSDYITKQGIASQYAFYPITGYYYVYTYTASEKEAVVDACHQLRENTEFADAWVFVATNKVEDDQRIQSFDKVNSISIEEPTIQDVSEKIAQKIAVVNIDSTTKADVLNQRQVLPIQFQSYQEDTGWPVLADIKVVDSKLSKNIITTPTWKTSNIEKAKVMDNMLQIIPHATGYRKVQFELPVDVNEALSHELITMKGDTLLMDIPLQRLIKGDIQVMYNTYFYGNSSVMRERSRYELDELVIMLNDFPEMRIKLHGHTNGNGRGFIYVFNPEEKNFFHLIQNKQHKKKGVSSTKLSALRAETIKSYLEHRGISPDRVETVGWGGKKMLFDPDSPLAKNNIRVEIEVLSE